MVARLLFLVFFMTVASCKTGGPKDPSPYLGRAVGPTIDNAGSPTAKPSSDRQGTQPSSATSSEAKGQAPNIVPTLAPLFPIGTEVQDEEAARNGPFETALRMWTVRQSVGSRLVSDLSAGAVSQPLFSSLIARALSARGNEPLFTTQDGSSRQLDALLGALGSAADHALSATRHDPAPLKEALAKFTSSAAAATSARVDLERLPAWIALRGLAMGRQPPAMDEVDGLDDADRLEGLDTTKYREALSAHGRVLASEMAVGIARNQVEVLAQAGFFRWALDMRFRIVAEPFRADKDEATAIASRSDDLMKAFEAFAAEPVIELAMLPPQHTDYAALQAGLASYRRIAAAGPFTAVTVTGSMKLRRGSRGPLVEALKQRLAQEGYYNGSIDPVFDAGLETAFRDYQSTHGFDPKGEVEERHARSLNIPIEQRIRQIELGLQRWRESEVRPEEPLYVRVNLPEFMMEVREDGRLLTRHKIVCGNNNWDTDPDNRLEGRINRSKLFSATIERVILNPRWHVPKRIQKLELDYELLQQPDYYQKHKFVVKTLPDGREEIYQDSGDSNALGRVKFVFPNPYGIFMHDTNLKAFFDREIRAFSHGCIRLQKPFEIMDLLLQKAAGISPENGRTILAKEELRDITLKTPVPIFVEYNSVGIDARGRVMFFYDVYGYDRDYFEGKIPYSPEELKLLTRKITRFD